LPLVQRILEWAWLKAIDRRTVDGLLIAGEKEHIDKVVQALSLICIHDPIRYRRLTRDLQRIWVTVLPGYRGSFVQATWTCELEERFVGDDETTPELVSSVIVHEATHARLARVGISYEENSRPRIERACIKQQLVFGGKLPRGNEIQQESSSLLQNLPDLSSAAMAERFSRGWANAARHYKIPEWLIRIAVARLERRLRTVRRTT
jgi:hypothetical protein